MFKYFLAMTISLPTSSFAFERCAQNGACYEVETNEHGAILNGSYERIYMGNDCDVINSSGDKGIWGWSNSRFVIMLAPGRAITFERQDAPVENGTNCAM